MKVSTRSGAAVALAMAAAMAGCVSGSDGPRAAVTPSGAGFMQSNGANVTLAEFNNSAFPYRGAIPASEDNPKTRPFLDTTIDGKPGHTSPRGGVLTEDAAYNDRRVLIAASPQFNPNSPGAMVVFFHGNQATLERDVLNRQQTARQVAEADLNAVLVAPQMAVDANDSSAGNFWRPGGFAEFLDEADGKLANLYPGSSRGAFRRMPVVIVAYSGGYLPTAFALAHGGASDRVRGVVLFDALYGEPEKFARWIESEYRNTFFVSAYSSSSKAQNLALMARLQRDGVPVQSGVPGSLGPGVVAFVDAGDVRHEEFVHYAWTADPLRDVLSRVGR